MIGSYKSSKKAESEFLRFVSTNLAYPRLSDLEERYHIYDKAAIYCADGSIATISDQTWLDNPN